MAAPETVYLSFSADINPTTTEGLLSACANLANQGVKTVYLLLTTPGGSVAHGLTAYNVLRGMPFKLITHNVGAVNSIGNVLFLAADERYSCPNATFMFHGVGFDITSATRLEEKLLTERLDSIITDQKQIGAIIAERTKISQADVAELFRQAVTRDTEYAKAKGIVQDIRDVKIPPGTPIQQFVFQR